MHSAVAPDNQKRATPSNCIAVQKIAKYHRRAGELDNEQTNDRRTNGLAG
jgi:hypothetical protein